MFVQHVNFSPPAVFICKGYICSYFAFQISRFMSVNKLKYFFAVDTRYVMKKLLILLFPYTHQVIRFARRSSLCCRTTRNVLSRRDCDDKLLCKRTTGAARVSARRDCAFSKFSPIQIVVKLCVRTFCTLIAWATRCWWNPTVRINGGKERWGKVCGCRQSK